MAEIQATSLRRGTPIVVEGIPYRVLKFEHRTPGNKRAFVQTKLRNLLDGTQRDVRFSASEFVQRAHVEAREMEYLYAEPDAVVFMDTETYDQVSLSKEVLGDAEPWLSDGLRIHVELLDGAPIGIQLPKTVEIDVREAEAVVRGQSAARSTKPALLANGVGIQVPPFIEAGDRIRVDPGDLRYIERCK
jgi:elongation factor P